MSKSNRDQASIERLRVEMPKGSTVYTILRHVKPIGHDAAHIGCYDSQVRRWFGTIYQAMGFPGI